MNPEMEPIPRVRFKTVNENGKLVRKGIFKIMQEKGDNPETIPICAVSHKQNVIRQKVLEEYEEFYQAAPQNQIAEAGDFLAVWDLLVTAGGVDEFFSDVVGNFQKLMYERNITLSHAELARRERAAEVGEYDVNDLDVVNAVEVTNSERIKIYDHSEQWQAVAVRAD